jgi:hypothetical protein
MQKHTEAATVIGTGVLASGASFYLVSSQSEPGRSHVVEQQPTRLICDCKGFAYRGKCAHVSAVVAHKQRLQAEHAEAEDRVSRVAPATPKAPAMAYRQSSHPGDTALPRRNNEPFSLMR